MDEGRRATSPGIVPAWQGFFEKGLKTNPLDFAGCAAAGLLFPWRVHPAPARRLEAPTTTGHFKPAAAYEPK
jgi:hypothetical protein